MRVLAIVAAIVMVPLAARADLVPAFDAEAVCWNADRIVVATQNDGVFEVTGVWRGAARIGERLALGVAAPADHPAARAVLFLKGIDQPASEWGGMVVSLVWLDGGEVFAVVQEHPRGAGVSRISATEREFKSRVAALAGDRDRLALVHHVVDTRSRVAQLRTLAESTSFRMRRGAIDLLAKSGAEAVPALHAIIADDTRDPGQAVDALAQVAVDKPAELLAIVREELVFWQRSAPGLRPGWWNDGRPQTNRLRNHYVKLVMALRQLRPLRAASARAPVTQLRDFWRSNPVLEDKSGLDQMSQTADEILKAL